MYVLVQQVLGLAKKYIGHFLKKRMAIFIFKMRSIAGFRAIKRHLDPGLLSLIDLIENSGQLMRKPPLCKEDILKMG